MSSRFYARYVPPSVNPTLHNNGEPKDIDDRPRKKKKRSKEVDATGNQLDDSVNLNQRFSNTSISKSIKSSKSSKKHEVLPTTGSTVAEQPKSEPKTRKGSKKSKPTDNNVNTSAAAVFDVDATTSIEDKHKSIRTKYQEASKANQQLPQNEVDEHEGKETDELERIQPTGLQPLPQPKRIKESPHKPISTLPKWLTDPVLASETASFSELGVSSGIVEQLSRAGLTQAFAVQTAVLSRLTPGPKQHQGDICISAFTGSGKTLAYTLPIIEALKNKPVICLRALIIVPTRELVLQVQEVFRVTGSSLKVGIAVGSKSLKEEREMLIGMEEIYDSEAYQKKYGQTSESDLMIGSFDISDEDDSNDDEMPARNHIMQRYSKVDVLICTPGRLVDHIRSTKGFTLEDLQWLIVDEADRLLDQSFQEWIDILMPKLGKHIKLPDSCSSQLRRLALQSLRPVRKIILSATMTQDYSKLVALNLRDPILITVKGTKQGSLDDTEMNSQDSKAISMLVPENLSEIAIAVKDTAKKPLYLVQLIEQSLQMPASKTGSDPTQIIGSRKTAARDESDSSERRSNSEETLDSSSDTSSEISSYMSDAENEIQDHEDATIDNRSIDTPMPDAAMDTSVTKTLSTYDEVPDHGMLVFTSTNESAVRLCRLLVLLKPSWASRISPLTKSIGTSSGRKALAAFRKRKVDILVATDLASRGLDLRNLAYVVNYDLPKSATTYIHRVGRTARAGRTGVASTLIAHHEAKWFWNEIGRSPSIGRSQKVKRQDVPLRMTEHEEEEYESALERLGREAKGSM